MLFSEVRRGGPEVSQEKPATMFALDDGDLRILAGSKAVETAAATCKKDRGAAGLLGLGSDERPRLALDDDALNNFFAHGVDDHGPPSSACLLAGGQVHAGHPYYTVSRQKSGLVVQRLDPQLPATAKRRRAHHSHSHSSSGSASGSMTATAIAFLSWCMEAWPTTQCWAIPWRTST